MSRYVLSLLVAFTAAAVAAAPALASPGRAKFVAEVRAAERNDCIIVNLPRGYYLDNAQVVEPRPVWRDAPDGDFTYSVKREFPDSNAARLLAIAESCYPPRDRLIDIAAARYYEMGSDTAKGSLWWCDG